MRWGKVIDHDRCIGCHACSVACKMENDVPLGSFRTWVKYVEKGAFPDVRRHFAVLRCNQCDRAPCTKICPTGAMYRRPDGIVDFDAEVCIGCKSCIQACPYDAIYMHPESNTAAKCNFCAHRIESGLEPSCVTACPERALLVGDIDDPLSEVSRIITRDAVRVRKPELGTRPKVFYKGVDESCLTPDAAIRPRETLWGQGRELPMLAGGGDEMPRAPSAGGGRAAAAIVAYDVPREETPWGAKISAYLLAKGIGAGALLVAGLAELAGVINALPALVALVFLAITGALLIADLRRPERFYLIITRPQWGSWLVRGTYCILAAVLVALATLALAAVPRGDPSRGELAVLGVLSILAGIGASGYSAFLFGQARGRAFWQSTLTFPHLVVQAFAAGCATLIVLLPLFPTFDPRLTPARLTGVEWFLTVFLVAAVVVDALAVAAEVFAETGPEDARTAARAVTHGRLADAFRLGVVLPRFFALVFLGGHLVVGASVSNAAALAESPAATIGAAFALIGIGVWEHVWVVAGQEPPLS